MKEHPVPHNILDIEFKLFGNFSAKQFIKLLGGAAFALGVYVLGVPSIIGIPLMILGIGYGLGSAMVPKFDAMANTIISAIIVSPRYVWKRAPQAPQFLSQDVKSTKVKPVNPGAITSGNPNKVDVNKIDLDELLSARAARRDAAINPNQSAPQSNSKNQDDDFAELFPDSKPSAAFGSLYDREFEGVAKTVPINIAPGQTASIRQMKSAPRNFVSTPANNPPQASTPTDLTSALQQITALQGQMNQLVKQGAEQSEVEKLQNQISELNWYIQTQQQQITPTTSGVEVNHLYGILVDKSDQPVSGAGIVIRQGDSVVAQMMSSPDGRFHSGVEIPPGEYDININKPGLKFANYRLKFGSNKVPAYKFRAQ